MVCLIYQRNNVLKSLFNVGSVYVCDTHNMKVCMLQFCYNNTNIDSWHIWGGKKSHHTKPNFLVEICYGKLIDQKNSPEYKTIDTIILHSLLFMGCRHIISFPMNLPCSPESFMKTPCEKWLIRNQIGPLDWGPIEALIGLPHAMTDLI